PVEGMTRASDDAATAHIEVQLADELPTLQGDPAQLRQVIHNLVANARDAACQHRGAADARITIQTRAIPADDGSQSVRLRVTDNGPGFAPQVTARVFEPYVTTKATGTGL